MQLFKILPPSPTPPTYLITLSPQADQADQALGYMLHEADTVVGCAFCLRSHCDLCASVKSNIILPMKSIGTVVFEDQ